ncbi:hypothetical protein TVNIR_0371 [Thioalkalivibrio nitratireducens DSM 14787]|uniref:Uncharacterized protein n=1 Tax=Thioalkalivibrio nitratireducens (strain DSM 14787 / UNIQEM 213 / ALEN2) TaxID=1255043 RepID=L0DR65_THIND|nr:hypothetical protein [Thioalkalivibrio nitratireducens]AGA32079.1 hypothetical protein TVNIR_0371 [Thioalkalivibrio nitratireducens DSM 14787]
MSFDPEKLDAAFAFDPETVRELRESWGRLMVMVVWADLRSGTIGALPRLRKRMLEIGESLRSLLSDRKWIPRERERVKGAMAASLNLRDSLLQTDRAAKRVTEGQDFERFESEYLAFRHRLLTFIELHEQRWGELLESLYDGANEDEE